MEHVCWVELEPGPPQRALFTSAFFKTFALDRGQEFNLELLNREPSPSLGVPWPGRCVVEALGLQPPCCSEALLLEIENKVEFFSPLGKTSISVRPQNICLTGLSS